MNGREDDAPDTTHSTTIISASMMIKDRTFIETSTASDAPPQPQPNQSKCSSSQPNQHQSNQPKLQSTLLEPLMVGMATPMELPRFYPLRPPSLVTHVTPSPDENLTDRSSLQEIVEMFRVLKQSQQQLQQEVIALQQQVAAGGTPLASPVGPVKGQRPLDAAPQLLVVCSSVFNDV